MMLVKSTSDPDAAHTYLTDGSKMIHRTNKKAIKQKALKTGMSTWRVESLLYSNL